MRRFALCVAACAAWLAAGCSAPRAEQRYELVGQVLSIQPNDRTITIRHHDIVNYMPGMTMPFKVRDERLLADRAPGDLVTATLVVSDNDAYLAAIVKTGFEQITPVPAPPDTGAQVLSEGAAVPDDASFTDQRGATRRLRDWRGSALAITFMYTRCPFPTFCPLMDRRFSAAQQAIAARPSMRGKVHLVSVSIDPDFDTPQILTAHAKGLAADADVWSFLTADRASVDRFAASFGLTLVRNPADPLDITHNLRTAVVDPSGRLVKMYPGSEWTTESLVQDLEAAARSAPAAR